MAKGPQKRERGESRMDRWADRQQQGMGGQTGCELRRRGIAFSTILLTLTKFRKLAPPPVVRSAARPPAALESTPAEEGGCPSRVKNLPDIIGQMTD